MDETLWRVLITLLLLGEEISHEESGYMHDLDLLIILHKLDISYPTRSECREKNACFRPAYLIQQKKEYPLSFKIPSYLARIFL